MNIISKELIKIAEQINKNSIYYWNEYFDQNGNSHFDYKTKRDFKSEMAVDGFCSYAMEDPTILNRITGDFGDTVNSYKSKKTIVLQSIAKEYQKDFDILLIPNYGSNTLNIRLRNVNIRNNFQTNQIFKNWDKAKQFIIYLLDKLEEDNNLNNI